MKALVLALAATTVVVIPSDAIAAVHQYVVVERRCYVGDVDFDLRPLSHLLVNGAPVDLYCGDRLLVDKSGHCWFEYGGEISPAPCREVQS